MGQKVHPNVFRLGVTKNHSSQWFARSGYASFLHDDILVRTFFETEVPSVHSVHIQRKNAALLLHLEASRPQELLPHLDEFKAKLKKELKRQNDKDYSIFCTISQANETSAKSTAFFIKDQLEKRLPFRRAMKQGIRLAQKNGLKGMKIQISGRLNGAEIARTEQEKFGSVSLQNLRADIDYTECIAHTIYGVLGIKVWAQFDGSAQKVERSA